LFSYERKSNHGLPVVIYIEEVKTYDFSTIQELIRKHLDNGENTVNIFYNAGRVTFWNKPESGIKVTFCNELIKALRIPKMNDLSGATQGGFVAEKDITLTFVNPQMLYLKCPQLEDPILAMIPVAKPISFRDDNPLFIDLKINVSIFELNFILTDEHGSRVPYKKIDLRVLNKE